MKSFKQLCAEQRQISEEEQQVGTSIYEKTRSAFMTVVGFCCWFYVTSDPGDFFHEAWVKDLAWWLIPIWLVLDFLDGRWKKKEREKLHQVAKTDEMEKTSI